MVVRCHDDSAGTHPLRTRAGIARLPIAVETGNPAEEQIVARVDHVHAGISRVAEVVPSRRLIDPADVEPDRIARHEDGAGQLDGRARILFCALRSRMTCTRVRAHAQRESHYYAGAQT